MNENATKLGVPNKNLVFETAGRIYVKVQDRFYELDFRNQGKGRSDTSIEIVNNSQTPLNEEIDFSPYVSKEYLKAVLNKYVTRREWKDIKETTKMLEEANLQGFTESIQPITVQTMQIVVGADPLQYDFYTDFTSDTLNPAYEPIVYRDSVEFDATFIKHYTLDGPDNVRPEIESGTTPSDCVLEDYCRWHIAQTTIELPDPEQNYYIYVQVPKLIINDNIRKTTNGTWEYLSSGNWTVYSLPDENDPNKTSRIYIKTNSTTTGSANPLFSIVNTFSKEVGGETIYYPLPLIDGVFIKSISSLDLESTVTMEAENTQQAIPVYNLLYGTISKADSDGHRSFTPMNGFTEILPGQVTAYIFKSASGDSYLDLRNNVLKLGDSFQWNVDGQSILYIKGAIVVDDGGNQSPQIVDRGEFCTYQVKEVINGKTIWKDYLGEGVPTGTYNTDYKENTYYPGNIVKFEGNTYSYIYSEPAKVDIDPNDAITTYVDPTNTTYWKCYTEIENPNKIPRGRSPWNGVGGYYDSNTITTPPDPIDRIEYQGMYDTKENWVPAFPSGSGYAADNIAVGAPDRRFGSIFNEENIYYDIVYVESTKSTYYCRYGGAAALWGDPDSTFYNNNLYDLTTTLSISENTYAWVRMSYINIASDVAVINQALIENLTLHKLETKGSSGIVEISDNHIYVTDSSRNPVISISSNSNQAFDTLWYNNNPIIVEQTNQHNEFSFVFGGTWSNISENEEILPSLYASYYYYNENTHQFEHVQLEQASSLEIVGNMNTVIIPSFNGRLDASNFTQISNIDELDTSINVDVYLTQKDSNNNYLKNYLLGSYNSTSVQEAYSFSINGTVKNLSIGNWYILFEITHSITSVEVDFTVYSTTINIKYTKLLNGVAIGNDSAQFMYTHNNKTQGIYIDHDGPQILNESGDILPLIYGYGMQGRWTKQIYISNGDIPHGTYNPISNIYWDNTNKILYFESGNMPVTL